MKELNKVERTEGRGHFVVHFNDGFSDVAFYDCSLVTVMNACVNLAKQDPRIAREAVSIEWIEDNYDVMAAARRG